MTLYLSMPLTPSYKKFSTHYLMQKIFATPIRQYFWYSCDKVYFDIYKYMVYGRKKPAKGCPGGWSWMVLDDAIGYALADSLSLRAQIGIIGGHEIRASLLQEYSSEPGRAC